MVATDNESETLPVIHKVMILVSVSLGTMLFSMTMTVANVLLPQIQGALSATQDQIAWIVTFNLVASAVATPTTGWLAGRLGRRRLMIYASAGFTVSSVLCGTAGSLPELILYRVAQGAFGAPMMPMAQAILLDVYPRRQHALVTMLWGLISVTGTFLGPIFGGYVGEVLDWRWAFYLIAPVGVLTWLGCYVFITEGRRRGRVALDWTGFLALAVAIGAFQLMLDRGQRLDWFESTEIALEASLAAIAFYVFVVHSLTAPRPFINLKLLLNRNFALGLIFTFLFGAIFLLPTVLFPPLLQNLRGFPESSVGLLLSARGVGNWMAFLVVVQLTNYSPRLALAVGFSCHVVAGLAMAQFDINLTPWDVFWTNCLQGFGIGLIYVPMTIVAFSALSRDDLAEGSALFHSLRSLGSSVFISVCVAVVVRSTAVNYTGFTEHASVYNELFRYPALAGLWNLEDTKGLIAFSGEMHRQAAMIGYINAFYLYTLAACVPLPLLLLIQKRGLVGGRR